MEIEMNNRICLVSGAVLSSASENDAYYCHQAGTGYKECLDRWVDTEVRNHAGSRFMPVNSVMLCLK